MGLARITGDDRPFLSNYTFYFTELKMTESKNFPQPDDAVLSDSKSDRGLVLGGIEGVKQRLSSSTESDRIEALPDAIQYGEEGLNLAIETFLYDTPLVRKKAYALLRDRNEPEIEKVLQQYHPWKFCENLFTLPNSSLVRSSRVAVISANGQILARQGYFPKRGIIEIWNLSTREKIRTLEGFDDNPDKLAITADGQTLAVGEYRGRSLTIWNTQTGQKVRSGYGYIGDVSIGIDNQTLAFSQHTSNWDSDAEMQVWSTIIGILNLQDQKRSNNVYLEKEHLGGIGPCYPVAIHSNNGILICSNQTYDKIEVWNIADGKDKELYSLNFPRHYECKCLAINPNGLSFATAMYYPSYFSPSSPFHIDKNRQRTIQNRSITLWKSQKDPDSDRAKKSSQNRKSEDKQFLEQQFLGLLKGHEADIQCLAFSPDGKILASGSKHPENSVKLWDLDSYQEICTLTTESQAIQFVGFHENGNILYTITNENVKAWGFQ